MHAIKRFLSSVNITKALWTLAIAIPVLLVLGDSSIARAADEVTVRWDIVHVLPPNLSAGGIALAHANDNSTITVTGSGTFKREGGEFGDVTGGGSWETRDAGNTVTGSGTYQAKRVVRFIQAPGSLPPLNDLIGNSSQASAGLLVLRVEYSDGATGILVISCHLVGSPDSIFEGITATMGFVDYWNRVAPVAGVDANRTVFHVAPEAED